jgi:hypothetical protein
MSAADVIAALKQQNAAQDLIGATALAQSMPTAAEEQVTEDHPTYPGMASGVSYPAWVVSVNDLPYRQSAAAAMGGPHGKSVPSSSATWTSCAVAIYDLQIGQWTDMWEGPCS